MEAITSWWQRKKWTDASCFDQEGREADTVWNEPGGVMSMVQVPGDKRSVPGHTQILLTQRLQRTRIVIVTPISKGNWEVRTLAELPHVHRFDIVERNGVRYLIACALKSGHEYKDDWSMPGKVYAAVLPEDLARLLGEDNQLELKVIKNDVLKNHGYYRVNDQGTDTSIISADCGVFQFIPPESAGGDWTIRTLLDTAASDAVLIDLDEDGEKELAVLSPFHGDKISIYKRKEGVFTQIYEYEKPAEFTHAIYGGNLLNRPALVVGHRKGERNLIAFTYNKETKSYQSEILDHDCGPANVYHFTRDGEDILISANRETDEVGMYRVLE